MNTLQLMSSILGTLAAIAVNPVFGMSAAGAKIASLIGYVASLGQEGVKADASLRALDDQLKQIQASGGPIPDTVWKEWEDRHAVAKARLANA